MGGEVFRSCFSLESSGWLRGCRAGSGSGWPCMHAFIAVPRGGAWSASHPWIPDLCCARCMSPMDPVRAGSRLPLYYRRATSPYPTLPYPDRTYSTLPACPCTMPILFCVSLTYLSLSLSLYLCLSVIVVWLDCIALCSPLWP
jgi:hypothetical protein